ncbi:MAG: transcription elongation factor GreA [Dehalococcoidales bacterium]|nr:transcription elongation factor GreA [Dehalococcoidales bacterium]
MSSQELSLGDAAGQYLVGLPPEKRGPCQPDIYRFVRWFGEKRPCSGLTPAEVANYAQRLSASDTDYLRRLEVIKAFLISARKKEWSKVNLAVHLKARKERSRRRISSKQGTAIQANNILLTAQGYHDMESELETLRNKSSELIDEIRRAAADKDFRENVPLQAAREQRGLLEGRIIELEATLKSAAIIDKTQSTTRKVSVGDSIVICDLSSGEEVCYTLVSTGEVNPAKSKISHVSPIGKALINRDEGEIVEVVAPAGRARYQIKKIER